MRERVKEACKDANIAMYDLAKTLGISKSYMSRVIGMSTKEKRTMTLFMSAVAYHLNVDLEWLMTGEGKKQRGPIMKMDIDAEALAEIQQGLFINQMGIDRATKALRKLAGIKDEEN